MRGLSQNDRDDGRLPPSPAWLDNHMGEEGFSPNPIRGGDMQIGLLSLANCPI